MFKSKQRALAVSQSEHQKLAGTLALLWGNSDFERPDVAFESFVCGVGLHDRAYGELDTMPIGELPDAEWLALTRSGFTMAWADPAADLIAKLHLRRLVRYTDTPEHRALAAEMTEAIEAQAGRHGLSLAAFERIDRITNLCDRISFDFCFEAPTEGSIPIFPRNGSDTQVAVRFRVADGAIQVDPWPFSVESHTGYLVGYRLDGYPGALEPVIVPYRLARDL